MPLQLNEDALGDSENAHTLAVASELAYLPSDTGTAAFRDQLGLEARLLEVGSTQVYVGVNDDQIVVAFRGTETSGLEGVRDSLLTDAVNLLIVPEGRAGTDFIAAGVGARFHLGFMNALEAVWEPLEETIQSEFKRSDRPIWLTGHSLGGALAILSSWRLQRRMVPVSQVYTFGAPMVGNAATAQAFDRELANKIFRYVNPPDPVPRLPTISLVANDYSHCLKEMTDAATDGEGGGTASYFQGVFGRTMDGVLNATLFDDVWQAILARIDAHGMSSYRSLIDRLVGR